MSSNIPFLLGGQRTSDDAFSAKPHLLNGDSEAVARVLKNECLSDFFGSPGDKFLGGQEVIHFESAWSSLLGYKHVISTNSWSTGLITCLKACQVGYGDEVICPPLTMSATASSILELGAVPIFCDIESTNYNLDPSLIEACITDKTKAIMVVHLFGHPADLHAISAIAAKYSLHVIEDSAHAPLARIDNSYVGGAISIGGFSLNYHKHIHCGEGGVIVTNDDNLAERCQLIRNHGENLIQSSKSLSDEFLIGSNYRLTELQAAIGRNQLNYLPNCINHRNRLHSFIKEQLSDFSSFIQVPFVKEKCTHNFYCYAFKFVYSGNRLTRKTFVDAVNAEFPQGINWDQKPLSEGYTKPLYFNKIYHEPNISKSPYPIFADYVDYYKHLKCVEAETAHFSTLVLSPVVHEGNDIAKITLLCNAIKKVIQYYA